MTGSTGQVRAIDRLQQRGHVVHPMVVFIGVVVALGAMLVAPDAESPVVRIGVGVGAAVLLVLLIDRVMRIDDRLRGAAAAGQLLRERTPPTPSALQGQLRRLLRHPGVEIVYRLPSTPSFLDAEGRPAVLAAVGDRHVTVLRDALGPMVLIRLPEDGVRLQRRVHALARSTTLPFENTRLQLLLNAQLGQVQRSRNRLIREALDERRVLEGRLHDGAQSTLFAAVAEVSRAKTRTAEPTAVRAVDETLLELREAVRELRAIVRGIYPAALREAGLVSALEGALAELPIEVTLVATDPLPPLDEAATIAAYLSIVDVLHAAIYRDRRPEAAVDLNGNLNNLRITVSYAAGPDGAGTNEPDIEATADRVRALNGTYEVNTSDEGDVQVTVIIPCGL